MSKVKPCPVVVTSDISTCKGRQCSGLLVTSPDKCVPVSVVSAVFMRSLLVRIFLIGSSGTFCLSRSFRSPDVKYDGLLQLSGFFRGCSIHFSVRISSFSFSVSNLVYAALPYSVLPPSSSSSPSPLPPSASSQQTSMVYVAAISA